jgi:hypothetical protein
MINPFSKLLMVALLAVAASAEAQLRIGFIDPALPKEPARHNAAALAFAATAGTPCRLRPTEAGAWQDAQGHLHAPEEFDVIWYHQGDDPSAALGEAAGKDLLSYLEGGGTLLLSGAAGRLLNDMAVESSPLRLVGPTNVAFPSGVRVSEKERSHPIFAGFDTTQPILLTTIGGNAFGDFYQSGTPHGQLLADGNAGMGERPLVEYTIGAGRIIFIGWRLPDFTTAGDPYRKNLEHLFRNMLDYLARHNSNHARLIVPAGQSRYVRVLGIPMLRAERPFSQAWPGGSGDQCIVVLTRQSATGCFAFEDAYVREYNLGLSKEKNDNAFPVEPLAVTVLTRGHAVSHYVALRKAEQKADDGHDAQFTAGLRILKPSVRWLAAPLKPRQIPPAEQSVLLGRSAFMAPGDGKGDARPSYEPVEDGGFRIAGGTRRLNRPIVHGQNRVWTGDVPIFRMDTALGLGSYAAQERVFPLWPRPNAQVGEVAPSMGTLRLGVKAADGKTKWLDELSDVTTTFRPGYTDYQLADAKAGWKASLRLAPAMDFHGLVCRIEFDKDVPLVWQYGGIFWVAGEANANHVEIRGPTARITEPNLPNGLVLAGWDGEGEGHAISGPAGEQAEFAATRAARLYHVVAAWGVTSYDQPRAARTMARLDTPADAAWSEWRERLKQMWFDCYIRRALTPEENFHKLLASPAEQLNRTRQWWDRRRQEFQIRTPDRHLNALLNWSRATTEYHRQGPGLVLGGQIWQMYSHISTGWYGKQWAGDHAALEQCLRFYGAMQGDDGFMRWISPSLVAFAAENNTPYWVDQVWRHYTWTGDRQFVRDLWPLVRKAVAWERRVNDPDGDGLFRDWYEYWNCDSNGKGPKAAAPSAMAWAMLDRAARLAGVMGDAEAVKTYRAQADRTRQKIFAELWREDEGRLGSIGQDGIWRGHPQTWEEFLAINAGLLSPAQSRRAMRWVLAHYGFEPRPGVHLLSCSDWWPVRWSVQWVPTGDTCLAALAATKSGDVDLWWPTIETAVRSAFRTDSPGINMGIANSGAGGGDVEDVDSVDPYAHLVVRGLFGIEPALDEGRLDICPALPSQWREASIRTPDVSYTYRRQGNQATVTIRTPQAITKHVRANLTGPEAVTPAEKESTVTLPLGPPAPAAEPVKAAPLLVEAGKEPPAPPAVQKVAREHQVLFDLSGVCNVTAEEFTATPFTFDYADGPQPVASWWGNPPLVMPPSPRVVEAGNGVRFLTSGRPRPGTGKTPKNLLAMASWKPYPLPGGAVVPVGFRCRQVWLLLQSYVHPMKNYIPNGEVVLHYAGGREKVESLVPPYNLDCYFQHFSQRGLPVALGRLGPQPGGWTPIYGSLSFAHADALEIPCDAASELESVELRATCSEGMLGLAGMTAVTATAESR